MRRLSTCTAGRPAAAALTPSMLNTLNRAFDATNRALGYVSAAFVVVMAGTVLYDVLARMTFAAPTIWVIDINEYLLVYLCFVPAAWILMNDHHVKVEIVTARLSPASQGRLRVVTDFLGFIYCVVLAWQGWVVEAAGVHHFRPGTDRPVARTLKPGDIIAIEAIQPAPALQDRINAAAMSLAQSREHDWLEASLPEFNDTDAQTRDGGRLPKDLGTRAFVADPIAGGRLLATQIRRARASATFT